MSLIKTNPISPLEELSEAYSIPEFPQDINNVRTFTQNAEYHKYWRDRIIDDRKNQLLYMVPAGYTHRLPSGRSRKIYYECAWQKAVTLEREKELYPLGENSHVVILRPDPDNPYDPNAIRIGIRFDDISKTPPNFEPQVWQDIGFVPQVISKMIIKNYHMVHSNNGRLINLYAEYPKNLYFGRVVFRYGEHKPKEIIVKNSAKRFAAILEE